VGIWDPQIRIAYSGGRALTFQAPDAAETAWAVEFMEEIKRTEDQTKLNELLFSVLPKRLADWVVAGEIDGEALPPDWKEQLLRSAMLTGHTGLGTLQQLTFRDDLAPVGQGEA